MILVRERDVFRKIDIHIARTFLVPLLIIMGSAVGLYIVADALGDLDDYLVASESVSQVLSRMGRIYLARVPAFLTPVVPMAILISGAFAVAHMARNNEITALKASGVSIHRILIPIFVCATLVSLVAFANQELVVPAVELRILPQLSLWTGQKWPKVTGSIRSEETTYTIRYDVAMGEMHYPQVFRKRGEEMTQIKASSGKWTPEGGWLLRDENMGPVGKKAEGLETYLWRTRLTPEDLSMEVLPASSRPLRWILRVVRESQQRSDLVLLYSRLSYPLVGAALLLIGVPFMLQHESVRQSRLFGTGLCILVGAAYYAVSFVSSALGGSGSLPAEVAGLLPTFLFAAMGVYLTDRIRT